MNDKLEDVVDIDDFQKNIAVILESKGVLSQFKNDVVPAPKKSVAVNGVKVKNDKKQSKESSDEEEKKIIAEWQKTKLPIPEDNANKAEIEKIALKYIDDINLASTKVTDQEEIAKFLS